MVNLSRASHQGISIVPCPVLLSGIWSVTWLLGFGRLADSSDDYFDELRLDPGVLSSTQISAFYDRLTEPGELVLAEQLQGYYFKVAKDPMHLPAADPREASRYAGSLQCVALHGDSLQICSRVSEL